MTSFNRSRDALEHEGVYIGGWSLKNVLLPKKLNGLHGKRLIPAQDPVLCLSLTSTKQTVAKIESRTLRSSKGSGLRLRSAH